MIKFPKPEKNPAKKVIDYGNVYARILEVEVRRVTPSLYKVVLVLETKEDDDFVGITTKKGITYKGAVGFVELSNFLVNTKNDYSVYSAVKKLMYIAKAVGVEREFYSLDGKFDNFKDLVNAFAKLDIYNKYVYWCLGGKYAGKTERGFDRYTPFIVSPKMGTNKLPVAANSNDVITFDSSIHIDNYKRKDVASDQVQQNNDNKDLPEFLINAINNSINKPANTDNDKDTAKTEDTPQDSLKNLEELINDTDSSNISDDEIPF